MSYPTLQTGTAPAPAMPSGARHDLRCAANTARDMGLFISPLLEGTDHPQAYMVIGPQGPVMRVSDHDIRWTPERADLTKPRRFDGRCHVYTSPSKPRRPEWWRRAYTLVMAGRDVPGRGVATRPELA